MDTGPCGKHCLPVAWLQASLVKSRFSWRQNQMHKEACRKCFQATVCSDFRITDPDKHFFCTAHKETVDS